VVAKLRLGLRAVVVGELQDWEIKGLEPGVSGVCLFGDGVACGKVGEEVEGEIAAVWAKVLRAAHGHAQGVAVKGQALPHVLDAQHGLRQREAIHRERRRAFENLHPVAIRVVRKGEAFHAPIVRLLLEAHLRAKTKRERTKPSGPR
jgi:hypothetical protein